MRARTHARARAVGIARRARGGNRPRCARRRRVLRAIFQRECVAPYACCHLPTFSCDLASMRPRGGLKCADWICGSGRFERVIMYAEHPIAVGTPNRGRTTPFADAAARTDERVRAHRAASARGAVRAVRRDAVHQRGRRRWRRTSCRRTSSRGRVLVRVRRAVPSRRAHARSDARGARGVCHLR